jgi:hypothetical protein
VKNVLQILIAVLGLLCSVAVAQQSGTINTLTVNPRQNQELTNSTGTESGQPSDAVPGSSNEPNGLVPVTSNMVGSGSNGNMNQNASAGAKQASGASNAGQAEQSKATGRKSSSAPAPKK